MARKGETMQEEHCLRLLKRLEDGERLSHPHLLEAQRYVRGQLQIDGGSCAYYKHNASGDVYRVVAVGLRVGVEGPAYHEVQYVPEEFEGVVFHRDWRTFLEKFTRTFKKEVWA